jgi:hypothetical protein
MPKLHEGDNTDHTATGAPATGRLRSWVSKHLRGWVAYPKPRHSQDVGNDDDCRSEAFAEWLDLNT